MKNFLFIGVVLGMGLRMAFGYIGDSYETFLKEYKHVKILSIDKSITPHAKRALEIEAYSFKVYALFDKKDICYEEYTLKNKTLPSPNLFIKDASKIKPKLLFKIPLRMAVWEYDTPTYKIIYQTFGLPGYLGADARIKQ